MQSNSRLGLQPWAALAVFISAIPRLSLWGALFFALGVTVQAQLVPADPKATPPPPSAEQSAGQSIGSARADNGQVPDLFETPSLSALLYGERGGFRVNSVSLGGSYFSAGTSNLGGFGGGSGVLTGTDVLISGSASLGWSGRTERFHFGINYVPSYLTYARNPKFRSFAQDLSLTGHRQLTPLWVLSASLAGTYSTSEQMLFSPSALSTAASLPASLDNLADSLLKNPVNSDSFGSLVATAPITDTASRLFLFGSSILSASGNVSLSYAKGRKSFTITGGGIRTQPISASGFNANLSNSFAGLLTQSTTGNVGASFSYSLSPRTRVGVSVDENRTISRIQDVYRTATSGFIGRKMGLRWFAQGQGGFGYLNVVRALYQLPTGLQYQGGGSLGYKTYSHTFLAATSRNFGDSFGIGAGSTLNVSGTWNWSNPRRTWSLWGAASQQWFLNRTPGNLKSIQGSIGLNKRLSSQLSCSFDYSYTKASGITQLLQNLEQHGARASLVWHPHGDRSRLR
jgi:hypothetical protein